jgi:hypothetical protein
LASRVSIIEGRIITLHYQKGSQQMADVKFAEVLAVKLPAGARAELHKLAERRYETSCSIARKAIIAEIEKAKAANDKHAA